MKWFNTILICALATLVFSAVNVMAAPKKTFKVCYSRYVGWEFWALIKELGLDEKYERQYGIKIDIEYVDDYGVSLEEYTKGTYDACTMTNMDALAVPAAGGIDTTMWIYGDYSNGNDGVVIFNGKTLADIVGREVLLYTKTVSHFLLARGLSMIGKSIDDVTMVHTVDKVIEASFLQLKGKKGAAVMWNPQLMGARTADGAVMVFNSSQTPYEIGDYLAVNTQVLKDNPNFGTALRGMWYDAMAIMTKRNQARTEAVEYMATNAGTTSDLFEAQLKTTAMFYTPAEATGFARSKKLKEVMELVRQFSFAAGLYSDDVKSADQIGIQFPDGTIQGNRNNVKLRFSDGS